MQILAPISVGELFDKISILEVKAERLDDEAKRDNVLRELALLRETRDAAGVLSPEIAALAEELRAVNAGLWDVEDGKRDCERRQDFGSDFIALARRVYKENDRRAALKKAINLAAGSAIVEEKSYRAY
jgi:hypothetical protein